VRRRPFADHVWRAVERYDEVYAGRLAAAIAYYAFFAVFALAVSLFAVLGLVLRGNKEVTDAVREYLHRNLPQVEMSVVTDTARNLGWLALAGLALAGIGWVESLRSSQRAVWDLEQRPGHPVIRWLVDLAVLIGLGVLLIVSISISAGVQDLLVRLGAASRTSVVVVVLNQFTTVTAGLVDLILAAALLAGVPRLRMPLRRLAPAALLVALGLLILKTIGRWYVARIQHNPAYSVVAGTAGLLVFMYLFHQVVLFAAAFAATSGHGTVVDLAAGPVPKVVEELDTGDEPVSANIGQEPAERP
jgi:membrane protein